MILRPQQKEHMKEIRDALQVAAEVMKVPILESEYRDMSFRLMEYHGAELFKIIAGIPNRRFYPASHELENEVRIAMGKKPFGLTEGIIDRFEEELVVSGQNPAVAKKGAAFMKRAIRAKRVPADVVQSEKSADDILLDLEQF